MPGLLLATFFRVYLPQTLACVFSAARFSGVLSCSSSALDHLYCLHFILTLFFSACAGVVFTDH